MGAGEGVIMPRIMIMHPERDVKKKTRSVQRAV